MTSILFWDSSDVRQLKLDIEFVRDYGAEIHADCLPEMIERIQKKTNAMISCVHSRPIIAIDLLGMVLTGNLADLKLEVIPYDPNFRVELLENR